MKIILAILLGGFFGYTLYKAEATNPKKLLAMLRLEDLDLAKIILFAIGFSSVLLYIANLIGIFNTEHLDIKTLNSGVIIGAVIFGLGFGYAGTCPGTCMGAIGGDKFKQALSAVLGGLLGAFAFSMSYEKLNNLNLISKFDMGKVTLFNLSPKYSSIFNIGFSGLFIVGILFMITAYLLPKSILKNK